jgi:hypothetical protein
MAFKIKDGLRIGTVDVFNNSGVLQVNAPTATTLQYSRTINGVGFDGSANINITVPTSGITGLGTGVATFLTTPTSANLLNAVTDATGTGQLVFGTSPTFTTSILLSGSSSGTTTLQAYTTASGTLTLPATTDTLVGKATTDTLTNKTLTSPVISTIVNTGTLTLPTSTDTLVGRATTDTFTNKTFDTAATGNILKINGTTISDKTGSNKVVLDTSPTISSPTVNSGVYLNGSVSGTTILQASSSAGSNTLTLPASSNDTLVGKATTDIFTNKTFDTAGTGNVFKINGTSITDTTGSGKVVLDTSPNISTSITTSGSSFDLLNTNATTINFGGAATTLNIGKSGGTTYILGNLDVKGTTTTIESTTVQTVDKVIILGYSTTPSDVTADGGGIQLDGTTNKTILWNTSNNAWNFSEHVNLATGKSFYINNNSVLSYNTLGSGVINSSLTSVGTLTGGTWNANIIGSTYGGTGVNNGSNTITLGGNISTANSFSTNGNYALTLTTTNTTNVTLPTTGTLSTLSGNETLANKTLTSPVISSIVNTGTLTLPTSTDTLVGRNTTDTLTNKSFNSSIDYKTSATTIASENVIQTTVTTTSATTVDSWAKATYRSAKYVIQITQGTNYQVSEIMMTQDGTSTYMTEYAVLETNGSLATFTSSISGANAVLTVTMGTATSATINITRTLIVV